MGNACPSKSSGGISNRPTVHDRFEGASAYSDTALAGRSVATARNWRRCLALWCVVVGLWAFADRAWTRSFIYLTPPPLQRLPLQHHQPGLRRHQHGPIIPPSLGYGGKAWVPRWSLTHRLSHKYTAQTGTPPETSLILASVVPFGTHHTRHSPTSVVDFSREPAELHHPLPDRPNCTA